MSHCRCFVFTLSSNHLPSIYPKSNDKDLSSLDNVVEDLGTDILEALAGLGGRGVGSGSRISFAPEVVATDMDKHNKVQLSVSFQKN